jgi:hypothetical protein
MRTCFGAHSFGVGEWYVLFNFYKLLLIHPETTKDAGSHHAGCRSASTCH